MRSKNRIEENLGIVRIYGLKPYNIILIHGGPGAPGEMKPVALELSSSFGVLEPFQSKKSIWEQVDELKIQIEKYADQPVILVGWSWGSWLSYLFAGKYPKFLKKLIIIASGPFEEKYVPVMKEVRLSRLSNLERKRIKELENLFKQPNLSKSDVLFNEYGSLFSKGDTYANNQENFKSKSIKPQYEIYNNVWPEAVKLRQTGELLALGKKIECPVVAIQGDYDSHIDKGIKISLKKVIKKFKFILLERCGHYPWFEKYAKDKFYEILKNELVN